MRNLILFLCAAGLLAGCATASAPTTDLTPVQAVLGAAERPEGVTGTFRLEVRGAGRQDDFLFLDSEADYRDQRCLVITLPKRVALDLQRQVGGDPAVVMKGKTIRVTGTAERVKIVFVANAVMTDKYYYQTQVRLSDVSQLVIVP